MGFLDEIKNKMHLGGQQGYDQGYGQDDDYGYDDGYDDGYQNNGYSGASGEGFYTQDEPSNGLLGQTRRGEAESVAVYTRSGQLVGDDSRHATTYNPPSRSQDSVASGYRPGAYDTPSSYAENTRARAAAAPAPAPSDASAYASNIINATPQLPAYVLRPESYAYGSIYSCKHDIWSRKYSNSNYRKCNSNCSRRTNSCNTSIKTRIL